MFLEDLPWQAWVIFGLLFASILHSKKGGSSKKSA